MIAGMAPGLIGQEEDNRLSYPMSHINMTELNYEPAGPVIVFFAEDERRNQIIADEEDKLWEEREVYLANERANMIIK